MIAPTAAARECRVLVIDDNIDAATTLSYLLQMLGCKTAVAFGGATAGRVAELLRPQIVFIDMDMPGDDGIQVLQALKRQEIDGPSAYYVCLTGRSEPEDQARALGAGFDRFVSKPMEPATLTSILQSAAQPGTPVADTGSTE